MSVDEVSVYDNYYWGGLGSAFSDSGQSCFGHTRPHGYFPDLTCFYFGDVCYRVCSEMTQGYSGALNRVGGLVWRILRVHGDLGREGALLSMVDHALALGGIYVKFAQFVLARLDNVPDTLRARHGLLVARTYDQVATEVIDVRKILHAELGKSSESIVQVESEPFASGSFAQVHRGLLNNGDQVAIKVLRPSVQRAIRYDLIVLRAVCWLVAPFVKVIDLKQVARSLSLVVAAEADYSREADNMDLLRDAYAKTPNIIIPKIYRGLSSGAVLTQELVDGVSLTQLIAAQDAGRDATEEVRVSLGSDLRYQLVIVGYATLKSFLRVGFAHGDPHPGNIVLLSGNRVALLDSGLVATGPADRKAFYDLICQYSEIYNGRLDMKNYIRSLIRLFVSDLSRAANALGDLRETAGRERTDILEVVAKVSERLAADDGARIEGLVASQRFLQVFFRVVNRKNRFGFNVEIDEPAFMRASLMYIYTLDQLGLKGEVLPSVYGSIAEEFADQELKGEGADRPLDEALEVIGLWLERMACRDTSLYLKITQLLKMEPDHA